MVGVPCRHRVLRERRAAGAGRSERHAERPGLSPADRHEEHRHARGLGHRPVWEPAGGRSPSTPAAVLHPALLAEPLAQGVRRSHLSGAT